jgi:transcriptional regulator with PAS, ATPase and Fis domain
MAKDARDVSKSKYNASSINPYTDEEKLKTEKLGPEFNQLIGQNIQFRKALYIAQRAAKSDISLLIIGESGTGKEILASAIHKASRRSGKPLIDVNCAAIPDSLIESELFGYEKGAFTGARTEGRKGYFDEAHEGTILLDEIGDASLQTQSKLLRVLESGSFKRVGGSKNIKVDVRVISSTNKDLTELIREKLFREDLYFRLNAFTIYLPPLRERREDIGLLVEHFLLLNSGNEGRNLKFLRASMDILQAYDWPGNVRELKGVVDYAVNMSTGSIIDPGALPNFLFAPDALYTGGSGSSPAISDISGDRTLAGILRQVEKDLIKDTLENSSNKTEAIKKLGISRRAFYLKIREYGLI